MTKVLFGILLLISLAMPTSASEICAPNVPQSATDIMPQNLNSFSDALLELLQNSVELFAPEVTKAASSVFGILCAAMLFSLLSILSERLTGIIAVAGAATITATMFQHSGPLITYASEAVWEVCEYGKLICPVLTTALAAQGGISTSAVLYSGTTFFISVLTTMISRLVIPLLYIFLVLSAAYCAFGEEVLKRFSDTVKSFLIWLFKTLLLIFTTYISVTGVVTGVADAAALKATKITISSIVPVVGSIMSDASEAVLISMTVMKNAAGIYGILAVLSLCMKPFMIIGAKYLLLKIASTACILFANKRLCALVDDFSSAMGFLLAMIAAGCLMVLISIVCYLKVTG